VYSNENGKNIFLVFLWCLFKRKNTCILDVAELGLRLWAGLKTSKYWNHSKRPSLAAVTMYTHLLWTCLPFQGKWFILKRLLWGHCMCKGMPVILVNKEVDTKRIIWKRENRGGGEAQGVADQKKETFMAFQVLEKSFILKTGLRGQFFNNMMFPLGWSLPAGVSLVP
jgi:hypothetical protein